MTRIRRGLFDLRKLFLGLSAAVLVAGVVLFAGIAANRLAHHVTGFIQAVLLTAVAAFVLAVLCARLGRGVAPHTVLELDLSSLPVEATGSSPLAAVASAGKKPLTLRETVETLERATADKRIVGLVAHVTFDAGGLAQIQELRDAIRAFSAAGKFTVAHSDTFMGNGPYYLASAFEEILLQPSGEVYLMGLSRETNFVRGTLEKLGVQIQGDGRYEYKNALNQLTEKAMTPPHREAMQRLLDSSFDQIARGVAEGRRLAVEKVRELVDHAPLLADEALDAGLVDRLAYRDEALARAKERGGDSARLLYLSKYKRRAGRARRRGRPSTIAVITATGAIARSRGFNPLSPTGGIAADATSEHIRKAAADKKVQAIVLRVDSPGGSAVASDTIWREAMRAKEVGKPVVVSMGNVAASGGYYIAAAADKIVAQPGTITGSIGVLSMKPILREAKEKVGLSVDGVHVGEHAEYMSLNRPFSPSEWQRFQAGLDKVYKDFTSKVAAARNMTVEQVHEVARGRVWTGEDAKAHGLVDELGGLSTALRVAKEVAGADAATPVKVKPFPKKRSMLGQVRSSEKGDNSEDPKAALAQLIRMAGGAVRQLGLGPDRGVLHAGFESDDWLI